MLKKLFIMLIVLLLAVLFAANFYLGSVVKQVVNTQGPKVLKTGVSVKDISINLLGGSVDLKEFNIDNVKGHANEFLFSFNRVFANVAVMRLLSKQFVIENVLVKDANMVIEKNQDGNINLQEFMKAFQVEGAKTTSTTTTQEEQEVAPEQKPEDKGPVELPQALLEKLDISTSLDFIDNTIKPKPFKVGFALNVSARNIATFGNPDELSGTLNIKGNLKEKTDLFVVTADMKIAPLVDPATPSFDLTATIKDIDMSVFKDYSELTKVKKGKMTIESTIVCRKGAFNQAKSIQKVTISDFELDPSVLKDMPVGEMLPETISFECNIGGTIENPTTNFMQAMTKMIMQVVLNPKNFLKANNIQRMLNKDGKGFMDKALGGKEGSEALNNLLDGKGSSTEASGLVGGVLGGGAGAAAASGSDKTTDTKAAASDPTKAIGGLLSKPKPTATTKTATTNKLAKPTSGPSAENKSPQALGGAFGALTGGTKSTSKTPDAGTEKAADEVKEEQAPKEEGGLSGALSGIGGKKGGFGF